MELFSDVKCYRNIMKMRWKERRRRGPERKRDRDKHRIIKCEISINIWD